MARIFHVELLFCHHHVPEELCSNSGVLRYSSLYIVCVLSLVGLFSQAARTQHLEERKHKQNDADRKCVLAQLNQDMCSLQEALFHQALPEDFEQRVKDYATQRLIRTERFLEHVKMKHRQFLENACPDEN